MPEKQFPILLDEPLLDEIEKVKFLAKNKSRQL